jgi:hypothetical protein
MQDASFADRIDVAALQIRPESTAGLVRRKTAWRRGGNGKECRRNGAL